MVAARMPVKGAAGPKLAAVVLVALVLALPAILNGFPLIFPDSGTYLTIAFGREYAVDRSSIYGLMLKPLVPLLPGTGGLWLAIGAQLLVVAAVLVWMGSAAAGSARRALPALLLGALATSLPWHAGQFMPDAFTGPMVLLAWWAAVRDPAENGVLTAWCAAALLAMTHYTHPVLLLATVLASAGAAWMLGLAAHQAIRRAIAGGAAAGIAIAAMVAANGVALGQWTLSPTGGVFLFARVHEDGLTQRWFARHCGRDAPADFCAEVPAMDRDSQVLLWGDVRSPVTRHIWQARDDAERWRWAGMFGAAARGAIAEAPFSFAGHAVRGAAAQFVTFAAIDDECPRGCRDPAGGIVYTLNRFRPETVPALMASAQVQDRTPKRLVRVVSGGLAVGGMLLLPLVAWWAWRRRDGAMLALALAVPLVLIANAAMAGALSDVHDRYQSRVVWLAPLAVLLALARWRRPLNPPRG